MFAAALAFGLLFGPEDVERVRRLAASQAWPARHLETYGLERWEPPREGASWSHKWVCPDHGARPKQKAGVSYCPIDGRALRGYPFDQGVYMHRHTDSARAARDLGLAYRLSGHPAHAAKARSILLAYAALYPGLPIHDNMNRRDTTPGARVMSQTLSEAVWLIPIALAYDLVRDTMNAAERARVETDLLRNAAAVVRKSDKGIGNWQSWHNAAMLAAGLVLGDRELAAHAIDGPSGFNFQIRQSIAPDGPWHEGAWSYHFYALEALMLTREMAARAGIALPEQAALKRMFDAPFGLLLPDGTLPNFNDSAAARLASYARVYEVGSRVSGDPRYRWVLQDADRGLDALLFGADGAGAGEAPRLASTLMPESGYAALRSATGDFTVVMKFGQHGGAHGHFDKLNFVSFAEGRHLAADPGTQAYGAKTHSTWDKATVAHNTVVVDERTQAAATGALLEWKAEAGFTAVRASAGPAYPGVRLERTLIQTAEYLLDVFDAAADDGKPRGFDWVYHNFGEASSPLRTSSYSAFPASEGYQHLTRASAGETERDWQCDFRQPGAGVRLRMLAAPQTRVVFGQGFGPDLRVPVPFVMARRRGTRLRFAVLHEPYRDRAAIESFEETTPGAYRIRGAGWTDRVSASPGALDVRRTRSVR